MSVSNEDLVRITNITNDIVSQSLPVHRDTLPLSEAQTITHLTRLADQLYPTLVHVVSVGVPVRDLISRSNKRSGDECSVELCGGT